VKSNSCGKPRRDSITRQAYLVQVGVQDRLDEAWLSHIALKGLKEREKDVCMEEESEALKNRLDSAQGDVNDS
jgi:hypothetical protein